MNPIENQQEVQPQRPVQVAPQKIEVVTKSNPFGVAGFAIALTSVLVASFASFYFSAVVCLPIAILMCIVALVLCLLGFFKAPRAWAVVGLVTCGISAVSIIYAIIAIYAFVDRIQSSLTDLFGMFR